VFSSCCVLQCVCWNRPHLAVRCSEFKCARLPIELYTATHYQIRTIPTHRLQHTEVAQHTATYAATHTPTHTATHTATHNQTSYCGLARLEFIRESFGKAKQNFKMNLLFCIRYVFVKSFAIKSMCYKFTACNYRSSNYRLRMTSVFQNLSSRDEKFSFSHSLVCTHAHVAQLHTIAVARIIVWAWQVSSKICHRETTNSRFLERIFFRRLWISKFIACNCRGSNVSSTDDKCHPKFVACFKICCKCSLEICSSGATATVSSKCTANPLNCEWFSQSVL